MGNAPRRHRHSGDSSRFELMDAAADTDLSASSSTTTSSTHGPIFKDGRRGRVKLEDGGCSCFSSRLTSDKDADGPTLKDAAADRKRHVHLWTAGLLLFTVLDCLLIGLLVKVSMDLAHLKNSPPQANSVGNGSRSASSPSSSSWASLEDSAFCLPCSEVYLNEIEVLQNRSQFIQRRMEENGGGAEGDGEGVWRGMLCCAEPHDDLKRLVGDMFIRVHYTRDRASGRVTVTNDTADVTDDEADVIKSHLLLQLDKDGEPLEVNGTHTVPLKVSKRSAPSPSPSPEHTNASFTSSVVLTGGVVQIVHPGHFYIHSHVPFSFSRLQPAATLTQYVFRVRNGGETLLLENSVYPCDVSLQSREHSFAGGVFLLESGDAVVLRVSNHSYVERQEELEFGVHRL